MFQQLLSRIQHDDNPRLHHTPFLILWVASYGLGWFLVSTYRMIFSIQELDFIFLGLLFGISLAFVQTWLLKSRYGYVPRFWTLATIIGATISLSSWYVFMGLNSLYLRVFHLYCIINIFQAIVLIPINRKAWMIIGVGILAGLLAYASYFVPIPTSYRVNLSFGIGRIILAVGTGLVMLQIMAEASSQVSSKHDSQKTKENLITRFQSLPFLIFWVVSYDMSYDMVEFMSGIIRVVNRHFGIFTWANGNLEWILNVLIYAFSGFILALCQQWLMKKYHKPIRHWILFTIVGWLASHILLSQWVIHRFNPTSDPIISLLIILFTIPILFQSLPLLRAMRFAWIWILVGVAIPIIIITFVPSDLIWNRNAYVVIGRIILALITGIAFLMISSLQQEQPVLEVEG